MREDAVSEATPHTFHWIVGESRNYNILDGNLSDDNQLSGDSDEGSFEVSDEVKYNQAGGSGDETSELSWERKDYASELEEERVRRRKVSREFFEFLTGRDRIFFVTGKAGCGKSTLLSAYCTTFLLLFTF
jgi:predicted ATPase